MRIEKTVNNVKHTYTVEGIKILREQYSNVTLDFLYGVEDEVVGFTYNRTPYYYRKNLQGDVIGILNQNGEEVAAYTYDAWGKHISITGDTVIANVNPIRYCSYYYDTETGLYYLNSRYYDPEIKRFINSDDIRVISETGLNVNGQNLFVYCNNNPVMLKDPSGQIAITTILIGVLFGLTLALSIYGVICAYNEYMRHPTTANLIALILEGVFLVLDIVYNKIKHY